MFHLDKTSEGINLLNWNKELPFASAADPLGLNLRVSARISDELLYCITSITPRARYYAFFPWAFQDYNAHEQGTKNDRGRVKAVLTRERAMVLGAVLHHDGNPCDGGGLGGSDKATKIDRNKRRMFDLAIWEHLGAPEGQFGAAYKGSLINLGVFKTDEVHLKEEKRGDTSEHNEETETIDVRELSELGKRLASSFARSVRATEYVKASCNLRDAVDTSILSEFGSRAGLCEINGKHAFDREVLRDVFFAKHKEKYKEMATPGQHRRRMSLLLLLECVGQTNAAGISFDNSSFSDICYFGTFFSDGETPRIAAITVPSELADIYERWRVFYSQNYLAVALQSMLAACVRLLRDKPAGLSQNQLMQALNPPGLKARFEELFDRKIPADFFTMSARETLSTCGITINHNTTSALPIDAPFSERSLEESLVGGEANEASGIVLAAILLYQTVLRYQTRTLAAYKNWYAQQVFNPSADIALPEIAKYLIEEFGNDWLDCSNERLLHRVVWRFVIQQHQTMSYERGFGGSAPLFHVDGTTIIGTNSDFTDPRALNPRLGSALQILTDIGLIIYDDESGYRRMPDGDDWLASELKHENAP
ncbi:MAG: hypothetical protein NVV83_04585 [Afipia sp.]|nr:hypothetical protein [Afipia sp.]